MDDKPRRVWALVVRFSQEDEFLYFLVQSLGIKRWPLVSHKMLKHFGAPSKTANQCRTRWMNVLSPINSPLPWTRAEDMFMLEKQKRFGNKWSRIAKLMKGRSENTIKNRFYSIARKNLRRYNKKQTAEKRIVGKVCELVKDPKTRRILCQLPDSSKYSKKKGNEDEIQEKEEKNRVEVKNKGIKLGRKRRRDTSEEESDDEEVFVSGTQIINEGNHLKRKKNHLSEFQDGRRNRRHSVFDYISEIGNQKYGENQKNVKKNFSRDTGNSGDSIKNERCDKGRSSSLQNDSFLNPAFFSEIFKKSNILMLPELFS